MIRSILDTDLYKLTMMQAVMMLFPNVKVRYKLFNRGNHQFTKENILLIKKAINDMGGLNNPINSATQKQEHERIDKLGKKYKFFNQFFLEFLKAYRFNPNEITFSEKTNGDKILDFDITIEGYWYRTILWEVPLMAIISEILMGNQDLKLKDVISENCKTTFHKATSFSNNDVWFSDMGTRRRYSYKIHQEVVKILSRSRTFIGTSNVLFGLESNVDLIGTVAHEWIMVHGAKYGYQQANIQAIKNWTNIYNGALNVALPDTYTTDVFLKSFTAKYAKFFDAIRQDSGDPFLFTEKIINHYNNLGIDPLEKTIIFSDSLNLDKVIDIKEYCENKIKCLFGIGTNLSNDVGAKPLNIVVKITECLLEEDSEWIPCIKLSDDLGKHTGQKEEIELAKRILRIK